MTGTGCRVRRGAEVGVAGTRGSLLQVSQAVLHSPAEAKQHLRSPGPWPNLRSPTAATMPGTPDLASAGLLDPSTLCHPSGAL